MGVCISFTTSVIAEKERFDYAREYLGALVEITRSNSDKNQFYANASSYLIGESILIDTSASNMNISRCRKKIAADGIDHYCVQLFKSGNTKRIINGNHTLADINSIAIYDETQPYETKNGESKEIQLIIPRQLLSEKLLFEDGHHGKLIHVASPIGKLIYQYLLSLSSVASECPPKEASKLVNPVIDLIASALNSDHLDNINAWPKESVLDARNNVLFIHVKQFIDSNLHNEDLGIDQLVGKFNLSRTQLYRVFNPHGGIAHYITNRRMQISQLKLLNSGLSISQIAFSLGFKSVSNYGRVFKTKFGFSPSDFRKKSLDNFGCQRKNGAIYNVQLRELLLNL